MQRKKKRNNKGIKRDKKDPYAWHSGATDWFGSGRNGPCVVVVPADPGCVAKPVIEKNIPKPYQRERKKRKRKYINYDEYLKSNDWRKLRKRKFAKVSKRRCSLCGTNKNLQVHHLNYRNNWLKVKLGDLRILCGDCHQTIHELIKRGQLKDYQKAKSNESKFSVMQKAVPKIERIKRDVERRVVEGHAELDQEFAAIVS